MLEIPTAPPSLNRWQRMHWLAQRRLSDALKSHLSFALASAGHPTSAVRVSSGEKAWIYLRLNPQAVGRRSVRIVRRYRTKRTELDHDNLVGGCKPLVDALVRVGLIEDDTPALVTVTYEQERGTGCRVEVRVAETAAAAECRMRA